MQLVLVFLMYALFGSIFTVGKMALTIAPPFFITGVRYLLAGCILCIYEGFQGRIERTLIWHSLGSIFVIGLFGVFLTNGLEFWSLQYITSGKTSLFYSLSPFFSIAFAYLMLDEKMNKNKWIGFALGILGFLMLTALNDSTEREEGPILFGNITIAEMAVTISAFTAVVGWTYFKKIIQQNTLPNTLVNGYSFIIGGILGLLVFWIFEPLPTFNNNEILTFGWEMVYITIVHSLICFNLYAYLLKSFSVTFLFFAGLSNPVFTAIYGWFFLGETVSITFFFSLFLFGCGLYIFYREESEVRFKQSLDQ